MEEMRLFEGITLNEYDLNDIYLINKKEKNNDYLSMLSKCVLIRHIIEEDKETSDLSEVLEQGSSDIDDEFASFKL